MKSFDKQNLATIRADLDAALEAVAKKHGIQLSVGRITFSEASFSTKLTALIPSDSDDAGTANGYEVKWAAAFKSNARFFGLKSEDLGQTVRLGNVDYVIVGMRPRAKNSIVLKRINGTFVTYPVEPIIALLNK
jgi:hypothetical protein